MIGTKFPIENYDPLAYAAAAAWCNENHATIDERDGYFEVVAIPDPTLNEIRKRLENGVQRWMDEEAQARGYDSVASACSYVDDVNPRFAADAAVFKPWRSAVWTECFRLEAEFYAGRMEIPTLDELIEMLPKHAALED